MLWAAGERAKLSVFARSLLAAENVNLIISAATGWELATKYRLGKLPQAKLLLDDFPATLRGLGYTFLPMSVEHALLAGSFTMGHKDPFDRVIAAQAHLEKMPLLSADPAFDTFPVERLW